MFPETSTSGVTSNSGIILAFLHSAISKGLGLSKLGVL